MRVSRIGTFMQNHFIADGFGISISFLFGSAVFFQIILALRINKEVFGLPSVNTLPTFRCRTGYRNQRQFMGHSRRCSGISYVAVTIVRFPDIFIIYCIGIRQHDFELCGIIGAVNFVVYEVGDSNFFVVV